MLIVDYKRNDPHFNIAAEEYLFRNYQQEIFHVYINDPSVIIGKHQNPYEEINLKYVTENDIPVIRRISGGGAVYHDPGNVNFSYILNTSEGGQANFRRYSDPILKFFEREGLKPEFGEKNEIKESDLKFSGNAEHVFKGRLIHHGTILFSSILDNLKESLNTEPGRYQSRAVKSNRAKVGNLENKLADIKSAEELKQRLKDYMISGVPETTIHSPDKAEISLIEELAGSKYMSWEWNWSYGPDYTLTNRFDSARVASEIILKVSKGIITDCQIKGDSQLSEIASKVIGIRHTPDELQKLFQKLGIDTPSDIFF